MPTGRSRPCARTWPGSAATCSARPADAAPAAGRGGRAPLRSGRDALAEPGERERVAVVDPPAPDVPAVVAQVTHVLAELGHIAQVVQGIPSVGGQRVEQ